MIWSQLKTAAQMASALVRKDYLATWYEKDTDGTILHKYKDDSGKVGLISGGGGTSPAAEAGRFYIPIPTDSSGTATEFYVEMLFSETGDFATDGISVNMQNAASAMKGVTTVVEDNGTSKPELVTMTSAGVPVEFFSTSLIVDMKALGSTGLNLLDTSKTYYGAYRWRATMEDDTTNTPWRAITF